MIQANPYAWPPGDYVWPVGGLATFWYAQHLEQSPTTPYALVEVRDLGMLVECNRTEICHSFKVVPLTPLVDSASSNALFLPMKSLSDYFTRTTGRLGSRL